MTLDLLDSHQLGKIHEASLRILWEIGVQVPHADMLGRLRDAGAAVDFVGQTARIPAELVTQSLTQAGKEFALSGRDGSIVAEFGRGTRNYNSSFGQALWVDSLTGERRYPTLADVAAAARVGDALPGITIVGAMADPHELPPCHRVVDVVATLVRNTVKPIGFWFHDRASTRYVLEIYELVRGSAEAAARSPLGYPFLEPISPLRFPFNGIDLLYETARLNLPVPIGPMAQVGMSAPGTLAGTLAQENAEILAGVCLTQLIRPGTPVCYGGIPHAFDMQMTQIIFSGPEQVLMAAAAAQLGRFYRLPVYVNVGLTDSKTVDAQAGLEVGSSLLSGALAGADIFGHLGICGADQGASLDILLLQHEAVGYVERIMRGIAVDDERLGLDAIREVGIGGTFIAHEHTATHFRSELWFPGLLDRQFYEAWRAAGSPTTRERVREEVGQLLREHQPPALDREVDRELSRIVAAARADLTAAARQSEPAG